MDSYRFKVKLKDTDVYQYKIADQNLSIFKQLDKSQFEGMGLCSVISMAVIHIISAQQNILIPEILKSLRNQTQLLKTCRQISEIIKLQRKRYIKTHRYEFGKEENKQRAYLSSTPNPLQIYNILKDMKGDFDIIFFVSSVSGSEQQEPEYMRKMRELLSEDKIHRFQRGIKKEWSVGMFLNKQNHFVSFICREGEFVVFNSLDEPCFQDQAIKMIINNR